MGFAIVVVLRVSAAQVIASRLAENALELDVFNLNRHPALDSLRCTGHPSGVSPHLKMLA